MTSRQCRMDEMIRAWRTIDELITIPANEKIVVNKNSKTKYTWSCTPELWKEWNKKHSVNWKTARERYWRWYTIYDACNRPKWWRPTTYNK